MNCEESEKINSIKSFILKQLIAKDYGWAFDCILQGFFLDNKVSGLR